MESYIVFDETIPASENYSILASQVCVKPRKDGERRTNGIAGLVES